MANIAIAMKIAEASKEAVYNDEVMEKARNLLARVGNYSNENDIDESHIRLLFDYSATLSSACATFVSHAILGDKDFDSMVEDVQEFDEISKDVFGE